MPDDHLSSLRFDSLDLPETLKLGIAELGFTHCTPIQAQTLPVALQGHDVAGQAQTGTGKTAAFLVSLFQTLLTARRLYVVAYRELQQQLTKEPDLPGQTEDLLGKSHPHSTKIVPASGTTTSDASIPKGNSSDKTKAKQRRNDWQFRIENAREAETALPEDLAWTRH